MDYSLYFESISPGEVPENEYQCDNKSSIDSWVVQKLYTDAKNEDIKFQFINDFLDYHFSKYSGNPEQFFLCLRDIEARIIRSMDDKGFPIIQRAYKQIYARPHFLYQPIIDKWIKKMENLSHKRKMEKSPKEYKSLRRVYSFILAEAYHKGHAKISSMGKKDFKTYVSELFNDSEKVNSVYQTVRSTYKEESNFLNFFSEMKGIYSPDYQYAMKIYKKYFPENDVTES